MEKKKLTKILAAAGGALAFVGVCITGFFMHNNGENASVQAAGNDIADEEEEEEESSITFSGECVAEQQKKYFFDKTNGDFYSKGVEDKAAVAEGDVLYTCKNNQITSQIETNQIQLDTANQRVTKLKKDIDKAGEEVNKINGKIESASEEEKAALEAELEAAKSKKSGLEDSKADVDLTVTELTKTIENLKEQEYTVVKSDISGTVYINEDGLTDPTVPYITVVSTTKLIKAQVTEFDKNKLAVGQQVDLNVLGTGDSCTGSITKIEDLPETKADGSGKVFNFYIKPDKDIDLGFSTEASIDE